MAKYEILEPFYLKSFFQYDKLTREHEELTHENNYLRREVNRLLTYRQTEQVYLEKPQNSVHFDATNTDYFDQSKVPISTNFDQNFDQSKVAISTNFDANFEQSKVPISTNFDQAFDQSKVPISTNFDQAFDQSKIPISTIEPTYTYGYGNVFSYENAEKVEIEKVQKFNFPTKPNRKPSSLAHINEILTSLQS